MFTINLFSIILSMRTHNSSKLHFVREQKYPNVYQLSQQMVQHVHLSSQKVPEMPHTELNLNKKELLQQNEIKIQTTNGRSRNMNLGMKN